MRADSRPPTKRTIHWFRLGSLNLPRNLSLAIPHLCTSSIFLVGLGVPLTGLRALIAPIGSIFPPSSPLLFLFTTLLPPFADSLSTFYVLGALPSTLYVNVADFPSPFYNYPFLQKIRIPLRGVHSAPKSRLVLPGGPLLWGLSSSITG